MTGIGCCLPQVTSDFDSIKKVAQESERLGYDSVWMYDHLHPYDGPAEGPCFEIWTTLSALAAATSRIRLGSLVLCNSFRFPSIVAKMSSTLDRISNGRMEIGIGAGWLKSEFDAFGIPFADAATRIESLREAIQIIKSMWTQDKTTYKGKFHSVNSVYNNPKPVQKPHPPLWVGGTDPAVMRIAAEYADGWNIGFYPSNTPTGFGRKVKALDRYCKELGRHPKELRKSWHGEVVIGETQTEVNEKVALLKPIDLSLDDYNVARIIGTPDECLDQIRQYVNLGASYFMFKFPEVEKLASLRLFAERVLPHLRQENSGT
jgi:F420-dependent oxidoreductase-like protein